MLWTEKTIEGLLESQTRELVGPDGQTFTHSNFAMYWEVYDDLIVLNGLVGSEIVGWAQNWTRLEPIDFGESFRGVLADLDSRRQAWGLL